MIFPGRHHVVTRFQARFLTRLTEESGAYPGATVVWAVTSANHHTTRRNPVPFDRREAAVERFSVLAGIRSLVVAVHDVPTTDSFAQVTIKALTEALGHDLGPDRAVVACSTPSVASMYAGLGYHVVPVEDAEPEPPARPWNVLELITGSDPRWRELAHPATVDVFDRYGLAAHICRVVNDPVIGDDGGLTTTRDYHTYAESFETASDRKWAQIAPFVRPGRILDIGCATGGLLERIDCDPRFDESDLIGVEVARHLMAECEHKLSQGVFTNPNVFFHQRNMLGDAVFAAGSIDTSISVAVTHEIWSYTPDPNARRAAVERFVGGIARHTAPAGVWVNSDVCGPDSPDRPVLLVLDDSDGANPGQASDLTALSREAVADHIRALSTRARFVQFRADFGANAQVHIDAVARGPAWQLRLADAMDFLTRKDYADNWLSESHEQFCGLSFADWGTIVTDTGLVLDPVSRAWRNDWIIEHRIAPVASISDLGHARVDWPVTHVLLVARKTPA